MVSIIENGETGQARFASDVFAFVGYTQVKDFDNFNFITKEFLIDWKFLISLVQSDHFSTKVYYFE